MLTPNNRNEQTLAACLIFALSASCLSTLCIYAAHGSELYEAGFQIERIEDVHRKRPILIDWWYPTDEQTASRFNYGLGTGQVVEAGTVAPGKHPLVLLSHGALGAARNYSWIAEHLARSGYIVAGISHFGESYVYGAETIDPGAVVRSWVRPLDVSTALTLITTNSATKAASIGASVDTKRVAFIGHSSGGATALYLAGARFSEALIASYCASPLSTSDQGCVYGQNLPAAESTITNTKNTKKKDDSRYHREPRIRAFVALDPALGPGFSDYSDVPTTLPMLIVGSVDNDFLPFQHHAQQIAQRLPGANTLWLNEGEGHFVFLNECAVDLLANGVPLCVDRDQVSRGELHGRLGATIERFLGKALATEPAKAPSSG